jgi:hypothetical protein
MEMRGRHLERGAHPARELEVPHRACGPYPITLVGQTELFTLDNADTPAKRPNVQDKQALLNHLRDDARPDRARPGRYQTAAGKGYDLGPDNHDPAKVRLGLPAIERYQFGIMECPLVLGPNYQALSVHSVE